MKNDFFMTASYTRDYGNLMTLIKGLNEIYHNTRKVMSGEVVNHYSANSEPVGSRFGGKEP